MSTTDHTAPEQARSSGATSQHSPRVSAQRPNWWQAIVLGVVAATVVNLLILVIGRAAGASFEVIDAGAVHPVNAGGVITSSVAPMAIGTVLAVLLGLWWPGFVRLAQVVGAGLALLTVAGPLMSDTDTGTQVALSAMHVVVGVAVVLCLQPVWRWAKARRAS